MSEPARVRQADDPRLDDYRSLNDQRLRRSIEGDELFVAEGLVAVERLVESGHTIRSVLVAPARVSRVQPLLPALEAAGAPVLVAPREVIAQVVGFDLHRGVVAAAERRPSPSVGEVVAESTRLAMLEGLNDPENLGAIARSAAAFGIDALVIDPTCTDPYSRRTVRVSMGAVLSLPVARADDWQAALGVVAEAGIEMWAMTPSPSADALWDVEPPARVAVLLGAEGPGLSARTIAAATRRVRIPIVAPVDSLNVGHAAAVVFAVLARPR
jgi:tRNA G18 (ribose-2'-O)-methylase SpoU